MNYLSYRFLSIFCLLTMVLMAACLPENNVYETTTEPVLIKTQCHNHYGEQIPSSLDCFQLQLPQNRIRQQLRGIKLQVWRFRSGDAHKDRPPLIHLQGGPGANSFHKYAMNNGHKEASYYQRDVIYFSQRGSFNAEPYLQCNDSFLHCTQQWRQEGYDWTSFNTIESAADVADLIKTLGYQKAVIYGFSYGTRLAQHILQRHPEVLASVVVGGIDYAAHKLSFLEEEILAPEILESNFSFYQEACSNNQACLDKFPDFNPRKDFFAARDLANDPLAFEEAYQNYMDFDVEQAAIGLRFAYLAARGQASPDERVNEPDPWSNKDFAMGMLFAMRYFDHYQFYRDKTIKKRLRNYEPSPLQQKFLKADGYRLKMRVNDYAMTYSPLLPTHDYPRKQFIPRLSSDVPVLIEQGILDFRTPARFAIQLADQLNNSQYLESPCNGHQSLLQDQRCGYNILKQFMDNPSQKIDASSCIVEVCQKRADAFVAEMIKVMPRR